jgi:hypothetical protein
MVAPTGGRYNLKVVGVQNPPKNAGNRQKTSDFFRF